MSRFLCENCRQNLDAPQKICPNCGNTLPDSPPLYAHILFQATVLAIFAAGSCTFIPFAEQNPDAIYAVIGGFPCLLVLIIIVCFLIIKISIRRKNMKHQTEIKSEFKSIYPRPKPLYVAPIPAWFQRFLYTILAVGGVAILLYNMAGTPEGSVIVVLLGICTILASIYGFFWRNKE